MSTRLITTESVSKGHPDKVADQISDAVLDAILANDPDAKVAVETMVKDNCVVLGGEVVTKSVVDYDKAVRDTIKEIGYTDPDHGFFYKTVTIINMIGKQSPEIHGAVVSQEEIGAGDQGFMVGYATNETDSYMPIGMYIAKKVVDAVLSELELGPDAKSQVTMEILPDGTQRVHTILVSTMHPGVSLDQVKEMVEDLIDNGLDLPMMDRRTKIVVNPAGSWLVGGPVSDCGLTGRKIVVDQYGPYCPIGGGAYSGKDGTKVDRSGAYLARYIAKNIVAAGIADKCKVEIAYMIGVSEPASLNIDTFGKLTEKEDAELTQIVRSICKMTPKSIIEKFGLKNPIYKDTASNGHYGRENLPWESLDMVDELKRFKMSKYTVDTDPAEIMD